MNIEKLLRRRQRAIAEKNIQQLAVICNNLGDWYQQNQQYEKALGSYTEEADAYERLGKRLENSKAHRMIGEMYMLLEDFDNALKHELVYLRTAVEQQNKIEEQRAYATIGRVHLLRAQSNLNAPDVTKSVNSAEKAFLKSLLICKSLTDLPNIEKLDMTARLYLNMGVTNECKESYIEAIKYFEKAMSICRHNDFWDLLHQCYATAGLLYCNKLNDNTKSLRLFNLAISTAERLSTNRTIRLCQSLQSKSEVLIKMADFQGAKQVLHKAYKLKSPDTSDRLSIEKNLKIVAAMCFAEDALITIDSERFDDQKKLYEKMGDGACKLKNFSAAIGYYTKMLEAAEKNGDNGKQLIPVYVSLYQTYKDMQEYTLALEYMWKEYDLCRDVPSEAFSTLFEIADTYQLAEKQFWDIDGIYERAKKEAQLMDSKKKEKKIILEQIALREKHEMETLAAMLKEELKADNFKSVADADEDDGDDMETESATSDEVNTPDIGDDICLDDLSNSDSENEETRATVAIDKPRTLRRRGYVAIKKNEKGETQLHRACISGNVSMVRRLLEQGHAVNVRDHAGWLPLHEAANHGFKEIIELLLDNGASINDKGGTSCDGFTPLHDACGNGLLEIVELLLDRGANATLKNDLGNTPLETLEIWRKSTVLNAQEQSFYETVYDRLRRKLERAGVSIVHESPVKRSNASSSHSISSITPRKRIISDSNSSEEEENRMPNSEDIQTIDNILDEEFPKVEQPENDSEELDSGSGPSSPHNYHIDYRDVMWDIRKGNFQNKVDAIASSFKPVEKIAKRPGMLAENEVSSDDWLDNDLGPSKKKRKCLNERTFSSDSNISLGGRQSGSKSKPLSTSLPYDSRISSTNHVIVSDIDDSDGENSMDAFNVLMNSNQSTRSRRTRRLSNSSSNRLSAESTSRQQSSLLESGFSRYRAETPEQSLPSVSSTVISPYKQTNVAPPAQSFAIKVKVSDDLLNVPVSRNNADDLTIEWLAEEAAKRYYNLKGVKPILRLTTKDGAIFENSDPLSLAFAENSAVASTVLEWIMPPLAQRYMEACVQTKTDVDPFIQSQIELIASTQSLTINDQILAPKYSRPLLKSLHFQSNLTTIDLTNSFIEDDGVKFLSQGLPTFGQLTNLNLSGNLITSAGVKHLSSIFDSQPNALPDLNTFILNFNPLQNQSLNALANFCQHLPQLKVLHLSSTELSDLQEFDLKFAALTDIDLSFNEFTSNGLTKAIEKLNACKLAKINVSFCGSMITRNNANCNNLVDALTKMLNAGSCSSLEEVQLGGCNLNDIDCWRLVQTIKRSKVLRTISLKENLQLTKVTWKLLLENVSIANLHLDGCKSMIDDFTEADADVITVAGSCCENVTVSLTNEEKKYQQLELLKRLWNSMSRCSGKIFIHELKILMTLKPETVSNDEWVYCFS